MIRNVRPLSLLNDNEVAKAALVIKKNLIARRKHMKPEHVKKLLLTEIKNVADNPQDY